MWKKKVIPQCLTITSDIEQYNTVNIFHTVVNLIMSVTQMAGRILIPAGQAHS